MQKGYAERKKYSEQISKLRYDGQLSQAIACCGEAIEKYPENDFFYKILGDLYAQTEDYENAEICYLEQLKRLGKKPEQFKNFARFYMLLERKISVEDLQKYRQKIFELVEQKVLSEEIVDQLNVFLGREFIVDSNLDKILRDLKDPEKFEKIKSAVNELEEKKEREKVRAILQYRLETKGFFPQKTDCFLVAAAEKEQLYEEALQLLEKADWLLRNMVMRRTLLRICRKKSDYSLAEKIWKLDRDFVVKSDFNVQYELVYYYETAGDEELLKLTLEKMRESAQSSSPIAKTLYNFYLRFNMFDRARDIADHILKLEQKTRKKGEQYESQYESEQGISYKLQELVSEQEDNRQMLAVGELIRGFSHELGQPITNIRYAIQLYQMKEKLRKNTESSLQELLSSILLQTERIGYMLDRFRPIVSSKSTVEEFGVKERITKVAEDLRSRMDAQGIECNISGNENVVLQGDPVRFDQIFYNLILNSMQAIGGRKKDGKIFIEIRESGTDKIKIGFWDNGPGIEAKYARKVFEPFFTTKAPSTDNGGEGLGLFVVWNILKMFNGKIHLDMKYHKGAKFIMEIEKEETKSE